MSLAGTMLQVSGVPAAAAVSLHDLKGRMVARLARANELRGGVASWDASVLTKGTYFVRVSAAGAQHAVVPVTIMR